MFSYFLIIFQFAIERLDRDITGGSVAGSSVFDPVKKKTRAGGGRSQPGEDRSTTGPIGRGTEVLVLRETVCSRQRADREEVRSTTGPIGRGTEALVLRDVLLQTAGGSRDLSTVKDR